MKLNLKARLVAAIAQFKAHNDIRFYLNGVYVEPNNKGVLIVATNGHAMGVWLDESGEIERPAILRIGAKLQAACHGADTKRLVITDDRLVVVNKLGSSEPELYVQPQPNDWEMAGKFPDWARVIRIVEGEPRLHSAINPEYIAMMDRAISIGIGDKYKSITIRQATANDIIMFTSAASPNFVGGIMPLRENDAPIPAWIKPMLVKGEMERRAKAAPLPVHEPSDAGPPDGDGRGWQIVKGQK
jgi:DNA polymerase III beta subunit, central domain